MACFGVDPTPKHVRMWADSNKPLALSSKKYQGNNYEYRQKDQR
jgi:hypothetical protein